MRRRSSSYPETQSQVFRPDTAERLSIPKPVHPANIPNRPSVYWLDYIESNEAVRLKTPVDLNSYYSRFYAKLPRLENLCRPKTCLCDSSEGSLRTPNGVPVSALSYCATPRIRELAQPRYYETFDAMGRSATAGDDRNRNYAGRNSAQRPPHEQYNDEGYKYSRNSTGYKRERVPEEMHGGDSLPSGRQPLQQQHNRQVRARVQRQSQSHPNISANKKQTKPTGSESAMKKRDRNRKSRVKLPPLVNAKNETGQQRKQSQKQRSNTKLPTLDLDSFY